MDDNIHDVEYQNVDEESKTIRGKVLYYSTSQVADSLGVADSKIRYYTTVFDDILKIKFSNKQRKYTEQDIEKLKFIIELKESGMTIKQIQEYTQEVSFNKGSGVQIKESNPLSIKTLATALLEEQNKQLLEFKDILLNEIDGKINILDSKLKQYLILQAEENEKVAEKLKQDLVITVDEVVSEKLDENSKVLKQHIDTSTEKSTQIQQENQQILQELALDMSEIKEMNNRFKEILDDPEAKEKLIKSIKKEKDSWLSKLAKKIKNK